MRVLHIITGLNQGGAEGVLYRLIKNGSSKNEVHVISLTDEGKYGKLFRSSGIGVSVLNMPRGHMTLTGLWRLYSVIRQFRPDVVQTWMYHADLLGGLAARFAGISNICWGIRHSTLEKGETALGTRVVAKACAMLSIVVPRKIVSCSSTAAQAHMALGYSAKKMVIIPNGYDFNDLGPDLDVRISLRSDWDVTLRTVLIGMVARWHLQKNHTNFLSALAQMDARTDCEWHCILAGTGMTAENSALMDLLSEHNLLDRVLLLGARNDIPAVMNALDVHVLSSSHGEAFPNVVAEAMACGTPCVVTDVGDATLIVADTGWVVPPSNSSALADALVDAIEAMRDRGVWKKRQGACRTSVVERFGIDQMVAAYDAVWRKGLPASGN